MEDQSFPKSSYNSLENPSGQNPNSSESYGTRDYGEFSSMCFM